MIMSKKFCKNCKYFKKQINFWVGECKKEIVKDDNCIDKEERGFVYVSTFDGIDDVEVDENFGCIYFE
jgi:hypothetical protein